MPRLDYSGGASCPSLLLEPQRTNLFAQSESFTSYWVSNGGTRTPNQATSPDGGLNATEFLFNSYASGVYTPAFAAGTYTMSIFIKPISGDGLIRLGLGLDNSKLNTSTLEITNQGTGDGSLIDYGNGWYRFVTTITTSSSTSANIYNLNSNNVAAYIWGAQLESGSYPTSYIPTYGSSVTRSLDSCVATSVSDLIGQTQGTMFIDLTIDNLSNQTNNPIPFTLKGSGSTSSYIQVYTSGRIQAVHFGFGSLQANINLPTYGLTNGRHKFLFVYNENDFRFYVDGALAGSDTSGLVDAQSDVHLGYYNTSFNGTIENHQSILFPTALTDSECIALTTI